LYVLLFRWFVFSENTLKAIRPKFLTDFNFLQLSLVCDLFHNYIDFCRTSAAKKWRQPKMENCACMWNDNWHKMKFFFKWTWNIQRTLFIHYKTQTKKFADFIIFLVDFKNFTNNFWTQLFVIMIIHKSFLGSCEVPQNNWSRSVEPFKSSLDKNGQTDKQIINYI